MTIEQVLFLAKAAISGNRESISMAMAQIISNEKRFGNLQNAQRLEAVLNNTRAITPTRVEGLAERTPAKKMADLILPQEITETVRELVLEHRKVDSLKEHNLSPRHKILMTGPPGNGKTSLAEAVAAEMNLSFYRVWYASLIGKYLGETPSRLKKIFEFAGQSPCVLFFDEFETVGKERGDTQETGEMKRVVSALLMDIDELPAHTIIICATNHPGLLDLAAAGRFEIRLELKWPELEQAKAFTNHLCKKHDFPETLFNNDFAQEIEDCRLLDKRMSYREIEQQILNKMRKKILMKN